jgi:NAD(P) transhydrogenase subunit alpha
MDFISILSVFVLACFVGYYVVWSVTPALHTPLMAVTNAISSVIIVGALIASAAGALSPTPAKVVATGSAQAIAVDKDIAPTGIAVAEKVVVAPAAPVASNAGHSLSKWLGLIAVALASVNIFGGFAVTARMLAMYKKKDRPAAAR